jgi:hypothetical protein
MEAQVKKIDFAGQCIYAGFDVYKKSRKVPVKSSEPGLRRRGKLENDAQKPVL